MPKEPPRREISDVAKKQYKKKEKELKAAGRVNSEPPEARKPKPKRDLTDPVRISINNSLSTAKSGLENLSQVRRAKIDPSFIPEWRERAKAGRMDLLGFWNDLRMEIDDRVRGQTPAYTIGDQKLTNNALDWLEAADQSGGLSQWLDLWKDAVRVPSDQMSFEELGEVADHVREGIEFATVLVDQAFGNQPALGIRDELHFALDAIGFEVAREIGAALGGKGVDMTGSDFEVVNERLREQDRLAGITAKLRDVVAKFNDPQLKIGEEFTSVIPESQRGGESDTAVLADFLNRWQVQAKKVSAYVGMTDPDIGQLKKESESLQKSAENVHSIVKRLIEKIPREGPGNDLEPSRNDVACFAASEVMREVADQQKNLGNQISSPAAKKYLLDKDTSRRLRSGDSMYENRWGTGKTADVRSIYRIVDQYRIAAEAGRAAFGDECWGRSSKYVLDKLMDKSLPGYDKGRADQFKKVLDESGLAETLNSWPNRKGDNTYGLAWQLVAQLRTHKRVMQETLQKTPYAEFMGFTLDAITDVIVENLFP